MPPSAIVVKCPECNGTEVWKKGTVPTRQGKRVRYICVVDGRSFYGQDRPVLKKPRAKARTKKSK